MAGLGPGEIVLMHVGSNPDDHTTYDADALPELIIKLRDHGYSFVTLAALVG
jgi:peptidoglycan/xylan/chitin deacetylase (PgdA/CDA1 family)